MKPDLSNKSVEFVEPSKRADTIFNYLAKVRGIKRNDVLEGDDYSPEKLDRDTVHKDPIASNTYSKNFVSRIPHISSDSMAFSPVTEESPDYTGHIMPGNRINKKAANEPKDNRSWLRRFGDTTLSDVDKWISKYTVNPVVQSLLYSGIAGLGMYAAAPTLNRLISSLDPDSKPNINRYTGEVEWISPEERRKTALWAGGGIALANLLRHVDYRRPFSSMWNFPKNNSADDSSLKKIASMLGPVDYVPKSFAMDAVTMNPDIPDYLKYNTLNVLGNIGGGSEAMINSTDMVNAGIKSGLSGMTGLPLGRIAAAATADAVAAYGIGSFLGVQNPGTIARNIGLGSAALRGLGSLF